MLSVSMLKKDDFVEQKRPMEIRNAYTLINKIYKLLKLHPINPLDMINIEYTMSNTHVTEVTIFTLQYKHLMFMLSVSMLKKDDFVE